MEYKFLKDKNIIEFADKKLHLSYSVEKEVEEFFSELKNIKNISFLEFIEDNNIILNNNKKHDTARFLKVIRRYKKPIMTKAMNKTKGLINSIKVKNIKVSSPENLEGDNFSLNIVIKSEDEVERLIEHLNKKKEDMKKLITTIQKGE